MIFTGDWSLPVREAEATNALADAGCDVITCHVDSPKVVIETAERRGVKTCGHNASQAPLAPKGFITGAEYKWETIYKDFAGLLAKGEKLPNFVRGGYDKDYVQNTAFGAGATRRRRARPPTPPSPTSRPTSPIFVGPLKDNKGNEVVPAGKTIDNYDVVARADELPRRGRRRLDHLTARCCGPPALRAPPSCSRRFRPAQRPAHARQRRDDR